VLEQAGSISAYRDLAKSRISHGVDEGFMERVQDRLALGSVPYVERIRRMIRDDSEHEGRMALKHRFDWDEIVQMVEKVRGVRWDEFSCQRGDWARAAVYYLARKHAGLSLSEIGKRAGGVNASAVSKMVKRFENKIKKEPAVRDAIEQINKMSNIQT
jgi:chromosomal replication initiation ATPase DnaA